MPSKVLFGAVRQSVLPSKYALPTYVAALYAAEALVKPNGFTVLGLASPNAVMANALVELSTKVGLWQVNRLVCEPVTATIFVPPALCVAVSGAVGTVKLPV